MLPIKSIRCVWLFLLFVCLLEACGFKGPLYLPDAQPQVETTAEPSAESSADTKENKKDDAEKR